MNDEMGYNKGNVNDEWTGTVAGQTISGEVVEKIDRQNLEYVTVAGCTHPSTSRQPSDEFDNHDEVLCTDCPVGWYESNEARA